jgi:hypothetical protein
VEPAHGREFNSNNDSVEEWDAFPYLEQAENIANSESEPLPHPPLRTETYLSAGAPLRVYIAVPGEFDAHGFIELHLQLNPYYPLATREEYKNSQCRIKKKRMKTYYDNMLKEEITALLFPSFKNGDGVQNLVASMPDDLAFG